MGPLRRLTDKILDATLWRRRANRRGWRSEATIFLDALAAGGTGEELGHMTPYLDCMTELRCMWFDGLYRFPDYLLSTGAISASERKLLDTFSVAIRAALTPAVCKDEDWDTLRATPEWKQVIALADSARATLSSP